VQQIAPLIAHFIAQATSVGGTLGLALLKRMLAPHTIIVGDACFAYFKRDIPIQRIGGCG